MNFRQIRFSETQGMKRAGAVRDPGLAGLSTYGWTELGALDVFGWPPPPPPQFWLSPAQAANAGATVATITIAMMRAIARTVMMRFTLFHLPCSFPEVSSFLFNSQERSPTPRGLLLNRVGCLDAGAGLLAERPKAKQVSSSRLERMSPRLS